MDTQNTQSHVSVKAPLIGIVSLILGFFFDYLFFGQDFGISFPIYIALMLCGLFVISKYSKKEISKQGLWLILPLMFFSSMVFVRSSGLLTFLNIIASLLLLLLIAEVSFVRILKKLLVHDYLRIIFLPLEFIRSFFQTLPNIFRFGKGTKVSSQVIKGIVITIPVIVLFLFLFSSADLIFQSFFLDLVQIDFDPETIVRLILILCTTGALIGAYSYIFGSKRVSDDSDTILNSKPRAFGHIETSILLGAVNVLFFVFILVQLTYLFGGENNIIATGFTYAEYARKGFFELIAVAVISFLLLFITEKSTTKKDIKHTPSFKKWSTALVIQVTIIMVSAFKRLFLYEEAYGFTTLRLYSNIFIVFLVVVLLILLYKIVKDTKESLFAFSSLITIITFLAMMNFLNPDAFIARQNIEHFGLTDKLDVYYLASLSSDSIPETIKILDGSNEEIKIVLGSKLYSWSQDNLTALDWQSSNISHLRMQNLVKSKMTEIEKYHEKFLIIQSTQMQGFLVQPVVTPN